MPSVVRIHSCPVLLSEPFFGHQSQSAGDEAIVLNVPFLSDCYPINQIKVPFFRPNRQIMGVHFRFFPGVLGLRRVRRGDSALRSAKRGTNSWAMIIRCGTISPMGAGVGFVGSSS
jgi:hypothetical protein